MKNILHKLLTCNNRKIKRSIISHFIKETLHVMCNFEMKNSFYFLPNQTSGVFSLEVIIYIVYFTF